MATWQPALKLKLMNFFIQFNRGEKPMEDRPRPYKPKDDIKREPFVHKKKQISFDSESSDIGEHGKKCLKQFLLHTK